MAYLFCILYPISLQGTLLGTINAKMFIVACAATPFSQTVVVNHQNEINKIANDLK
jgi:hypothetical protein